MKIVIDPGHGKWSRRRWPDGSCETDIVFQTAINLALLLRWEGHTPLLTKTTRDACPSPRERALFSVRQNPDIFISLHCNASGNKDVRGVCGLFYGRNVKEQIAPDDQILAPNGRALSRAIAGELHEITGIPLRGPQGAKLWYRCPQNLTVLAAGRNWARSKAACLIEAGFLSNDIDRSIMGSERGPDMYATACARGIHRYAGLAIPDSWSIPSRRDIIESEIKKLSFLKSYTREIDKTGYSYTVRFE